MEEPSKIKASGLTESKTKPWFVYICKSKAGHYYVGISPDPKQRLLKHNTGQGSKMASDQGQFRLLYTSKAFTNKSEARKREIQIKGWTIHKKEKLISGQWK
ncbi:MAG TPA: GIY-YIG nuclease family protein [Candidatus Saccharimonadales bacterium]|nr:GIY-YIG nuclease family protein [Candidatus Saccharimonadales bacterium]